MESRIIKRAIMIFLVFPGIILYSIDGYSIKPAIPISIDLSMDGTPAVGGEVVFTLNIIPLIDAPKIKILYQIPEGLEVISGRDSWEGAMSKGEERELEIRVRIPDKKRYVIIGGATIDFLDGSRLGDTRSLLIDLGIREKPRFSPRSKRDRDGNPVIEFRGKSEIRILR